MSPVTQTGLKLIYIRAEYNLELLIILTLPQNAGITGELHEHLLYYFLSSKKHYTQILIRLGQKNVTRKNTNQKENHKQTKKNPKKPRLGCELNFIKWSSLFCQKGQFVGRQAWKQARWLEKCLCIYFVFSDFGTGL